MNNGQKWLISLLVGLLFIIISLPWTYQATNAVFENLGLQLTSSGGPTLTGIAVHAVVFILLFRLVLIWFKDDKKDDKDDKTKK